MIRNFEKNDFPILLETLKIVEKKENCRTQDMIKNLSINEIQRLCRMHRPISPNKSIFKLLVIYVYNVQIKQLLMSSSYSIVFWSQDAKTYTSLFHLRFQFSKELIFGTKSNFRINSFIFATRLVRPQLRWRQTLQKSNVQKPLRIATRSIFRENIFYIFEKLNNN